MIPVHYRYATLQKISLAKRNMKHTALFLNEKAATFAGGVLILCLLCGDVTVSPACTSLGGPIHRVYQVMLCRHSRSHVSFSKTSYKNKQTRPRALVRFVY